MLENSRRDAGKDANPSINAGPLAARKPRSCIVCRSRKVKCDKQVPCGNCRRAKISCDRPTRDQVPRWARNLESRRQPATSSAENDALTQRLHHLEATVADLTHRLNQSTSPSNISDRRPSRFPQNRDAAEAVSSTSGSTPIGRIVAVDSQNGSHYVSSAFWSKMGGEIAQADEDQADDNEVSDDDSEDFPDHLIAENSLFHNRVFKGATASALHPLPSQVPFLLKVFTENVYYVMPVVHMPSLQTLLRRARTTKALTAAEESLTFSIYYCSIASMEDEAVLTNFGLKKTDLLFRFRTGLEHALARAEFIEQPVVTTMQAWVLFLCLARRHESPRFVWMMVGLAIRMAHFLGLQRDGSHFPAMKPFDVEMRRRLWWAVYNLEIRASEDQGTSPSIAQFDTKVPLNINDSDINPDTALSPSERAGKTDMSTLRVLAGISEISRKLSVLSHNEQTDPQVVDSLLSEVMGKFEEEYFPKQYELSTSIVDFIAHHVARVILSKLTLLSFGPVIYDSDNARLTTDLRFKLLIASIELAEYNYVLNTQMECQRFKWLYATHPHYYALVFLALELRRRPWTPMSERGFVAMRTNWKLPSPSQTAKQKMVWIPLHRLVRAVKTYRNSQITRLRQDPAAMDKLDTEESSSPLPSSAGLLADGTSHETYRTRWRQLVGNQDAPAAYNQQHSAASPTVSGDVDVQAQLMPSSDQHAHAALSSSAPDWVKDSANNLDLDSWLADSTAHGVFDGMLDSTMTMDIDQGFDWNEWTQIARGVEP